MSAKQHKNTAVLAVACFQRHSQLHACLTSLMFLRSQVRTSSKAVPRRPSGSPAQSLAPSGWRCMIPPWPTLGRSTLVKLFGRINVSVFQTLVAAEPCRLLLESLDLQLTGGKPGVKKLIVGLKLFGQKTEHFASFSGPLQCR